MIEHRKDNPGADTTAGENTIRHAIEHILYSPEYWRELTYRDAEAALTVLRSVLPRRRNEVDRSEYCSHCRTYHLPPTWPSCNKL